MVAQVAALDHPDAFSALTLAGTRPVAPGRLDNDLPDHDAATMDQLFSRSMPDWSDRAAVAESAAGRAGILGDDPAAARATAERIWDRTPSTQPAVQMANQLAMVFSKLNCKPRSRARSPMRSCSCSNGPRRRSPMRPPAKSRRRCSPSRRSRLGVRTSAGSRLARAFAGFDELTATSVATASMEFGRAALSDPQPSRP
jgi:hypothetical protein